MRKGLCMPYNKLKFAQLAVGASLAIAASSIAASATTLSDGTFNSSDVTQTTVYNSDTAGTTVTPSVPCSSCGNPGAGIQVFADFSQSSLPAGTLINLAVGFIDSVLSYNPTTQGAISSITASADKNLTTTTPGNAVFLPGGNTFHPMIEQDGNYYIGSIPGPTVPEPGSTGYNTLSQSGLVASNFVLFDFSTDTYGTANPNFAGDPMVFGLAQIFGFFPGYTSTADYDNLSFTVEQTTPLPATLPLFASGLGAIGLLGRRRKRKAQAAA